MSAGYDTLYGHLAHRVTRSASASRRHRCLLRAAAMGLLRGGDALDVGGGTSREVAGALAAAGYRVTTVDLAAATFPPESFDLVTAFDSIARLPREEHGPVLRRAAGWLRPGGGLVASLGASGGDTYGEDWRGVPTHWSSWDHRTNHRLLVEAGLEVLVDTVDTMPEDGQPVAFQWLVAAKR